MEHGLKKDRAPGARFSLLGHFGCKKYLGRNRCALSCSALVFATQALDNALRRAPRRVATPMAFVLVSGEVAQRLNGSACPENAPG